MTWITVAALMLGAAIAGQPLRPSATVTNDTGAALYVVLTLEPDAVFTNTTEHSFAVLDALGLRSLADLRVEEHEEAIDRLEARLAEIDRALTGYRTERAAGSGETP